MDEIIKQIQNENYRLEILDKRLKQLRKELKKPLPPIMEKTWLILKSRSIPAC